jgi:hypothetical protein
MRFFFICFILFYSLSTFSQEEKITIYWEKQKKIYERDVFNNDKVLLKEKYIFHFNDKHDVMKYIDYEKYVYNGKKKYSYSLLWDIRSNSTIVLWNFDENINEIGQFDKSVILNVNFMDFSALGSVQSIYYRGGKDEIYAPGEYYYDFPADPDSIFNAIPKELGLPDTLLHIKYKQPWME